ncbi:MAG: hypothetical protein AAFQ94_24935 [Bacteroidota bacterium]
MKKLLVGALVGGLILFIWQFLSWSLLNIHLPEMQYTPAQDDIMEVLSGAGLEDGGYFIPTVPEGASMEEMEVAQQEAMGKPWATITYHKSFELNMASNLTRGFTIDFLAVLLLCWIFGKFRELNMSSVLLSCLAIGFIGFLTIVYLENIWFEVRTMGYLIDTVVSWGVVGFWLGFWLPRN